MKHIYTVTIESPEADDDYEFDVLIERHGKEIGSFTGPMMPSMRRIGEIVMQDVEGEQCA